MKSALILSGQIRNFEECFPSLKKHILDCNDVDIYMHAYIDDQAVQKAIDLYKPKQVLLTDHTKFFSMCEQCLNSQPQKETMYWMHHNIKRVFNIIPTEIRYDCVIKARYDISYTKTLTVAEYDMSCINIPAGGDFLGGYGDLFAFSNYENMLYYCSIIDYINKYVTVDNINCHPETLLKKHLADKKITRFDMPIYLRNICMTDY